MLHHISWHQYLTFALVATIIYYLVVILRCYRPELRNLQNRFSSNNDDNALQSLQYPPADEEIISAPVQNPGAYTHHQESISDTDILAGQLKACIAKAADKPFAPAVLIPQLKTILRIPREGIASTDRDAINALIVNECEKTGTALLTEDEVDQWWSQ